MFRVVKAEQKYLDMMKNSLRKEDLAEVWASSHYTGPEAIQKSFEVSSKCWIALKDKEPFICFGVAPKSLIGKTGVPWMLATDTILEAKIFFLKKSKYYINKMREGFSLLENWVDARNTLSRKWIKWCGYTIGKKEVYGMEKLPFFHFYMEGKGA